jgi:choline dehydrogenase-like flavoprotein
MLIQQREEYDAIVVGSGISGGWAAKELTEKGLRTLVLERGRPLEHKKDYVTEHKRDHEFALRQRRIPVDSPLAKDYPVQARTGQFVEAAVHFFVKDTKHPYAEDKPFTWIQGDQVGGRSLRWVRQCGVGISLECLWSFRGVAC